MIRPKNLSDVLDFLSDAECIAEGSDREVFLNVRWPGWVVKVLREDYENMDQNETEIQNYSAFVALSVLTGIKIPETFAVDRYVVQEHVVGGHPPNCIFTGGVPVYTECHCGADVCWAERSWEMTCDNHPLNFIETPHGDIYCVDMGFSSWERPVA